MTSNVIQFFLLQSRSNIHNAATFECVVTFGIQ